MRVIAAGSVDNLIGGSTVWQWWNNRRKNCIDLRTVEDFPYVRTVHVTGMSSRIGTVLNGKKTYIGGAPRSLDRGQVLLFEPAVNDEDDTLHITPDHYLTGDQFGAGFGYDIALVDFNSDGCVHCDLCVT